MLMGTTVTIDAPAAGQPPIDRAFEWFRTVEQICTRFDPASELCALTQRVMTSGFVTYGPWWAGETLAWGCGTRGDPTRVVRAWLNSPEHRAIILSSRYHLVGIGRVYGTFLGHPGASVWTVDWGHR